MFLLLYCDLAFIADSSYKSINCAKFPTNLALLIWTPISAFEINPNVQRLFPSQTSITLITSILNELTNFTQAHSNINNCSLQPHNVIRNNNHTTTLIVYTRSLVSREWKAKNFATTTCHDCWYCWCLMKIMGYSFCLRGYIGSLVPDVLKGGHEIQRGGGHKSGSYKTVVVLALH